MRPKQAVSILRVSTLKQQKQGGGIDTQRRDNNRYIDEKGYRLFREIEIAETGSKSDRKIFEEALRFIIDNKKKIDVVVLWKVDRFARAVEAYYAFKGLVAKQGIRIEYTTQEFDDSPMGKMTEGLYALMAQMENDIRRERTIKSATALAKEGYWMRFAPTGFRNARDARNKSILEPRDEKQWELLSYGLHKQLLGTHTVTEVAKELTKKGLTTNVRLQH